MSRKHCHGTRVSFGFIALALRRETSGLRNVAFASLVGSRALFGIVHVETNSSPVGSQSLERATTHKAPARAPVRVYSVQKW
jgi:hypothetical protein